MHCTVQKTDKAKPDGVASGGIVHHRCPVRDMKRQFKVLLMLLFSPQQFHECPINVEHRSADNYFGVSMYVVYNKDTTTN